MLERAANISKHLRIHYLRLYQLELTQLALDVPKCW